MKRLLPVFFIVASALMTGLAFPALADRYVATNRPAGGDGSSWANAFTNIQTAFDAAGMGDTIYLAGHTFLLTNQLIWPAASNVTLLGGYAATNAVGPADYDTVKWPTILTPKPGNAHRVLLLQNTTNVLIERVIIRGGSAVQGSGLYADNASGQIRHAVFENNISPSGNYYGRGGGAFLLGGGVTFEHVVFANNRANTLNTGWSAYGGGIYVGSGMHCFRNVLGAANVAADGGTFTAAMRGSFLYVDGGIATVENATLVHHSVGTTLYRNGGTLQVANSILWDNDGGDFAGTITFSNCCATGLTAGVQGNLTNDPLFETPLFYLAANSPLLGQGDRTAAAAGVAGLTVLTNGSTYADPGSEMVNLGYHHPEGIVWDLDLYVAPGGSGDGSSAGNPLGSITAALAQAAPRTRIHLAAGFYINGVETFPLRIDTRTIQLLGTNRAGTVINCASAAQPAIVLQNSLGDNRFEGVTITSGGSGGGTARGMEINNATFTLDDCVFTNCYYVLGPGLYAVSAHGLIEDSLFINNDTPTPGAPVYHNSGGAVYMNRGGLMFDRVALSGNRVNAQSGSGWTASGGAVGIHGGVHRFRNILAVRNSLTGYSRKGSAVYVADAIVAIESTTIATNTGGAGIYRDSGAVTAYNTVLWDNPAHDYLGTIIFSNCCATGLTAGVQGNMTNDPLFSSVISNDYSLLKTSPCIDKGLKFSWMVDGLDLARNPRLNLHVPDLGAYEVQQPPRATVLIFR